MEIGDTGVEILSEYSLLDTETLDLQENYVNPLGAIILSEKTKWRNLKTLCLSKNRIGHKGARVLSKNGSWTKLTELDLSYNSIFSKGVTALSKSSLTEDVQLRVPFCHIEIAVF